MSPRQVGVGLVLAMIVGGGLAVRLINNDYGLPYVYNYDEETHFVSQAVQMFATGDLDPGYYQNPSAYTYILHAVMRVLYGGLPLFGSLADLPFGTLSRQFAFDPTSLWILGRATAALLAMAGVVATFWVGRRLWDARVGLVAAATLSFAFLAVAYSRIAVTDVGTFVPVVLAVYGAVRVLEVGRRRDYLLAGAATGLAIGFKYTAGLVLLPLLVAFALRLREQVPALRSPRALRSAIRANRGLRRRAAAVWSLHRRPEARSLLLALVAMVAVFAISNPYFFLNPLGAASQLKQQAEAAGLTDKFGQLHDNGPLYYLTSLTWGFGFAAILASLAGAAIEFRRNRARAVLLLVFPIALLLYMSTQSRYFARWLLPLYPVLALLVGVALTRLADLVPGRRAVKAAALAAITAVVLLQPVLADVRSTVVLGREDTRNEARRFLAENYPPGLRVSIEAGVRAVPDSFYQLRRPADPESLVADLCTGLEKVATVAARPDCVPINKEQFIQGYFRDIRRNLRSGGEGGIAGSIAALRPGIIDLYRDRGICLVVTMGTVRGRAVNAGAARPLAYYRRLEREGTVIFSASPFDRGARPLPFDFDFSYNYYPAAFGRPGPQVDIYRLNNCNQRYGRIPTVPNGTKGLQKGVGTSFRGFEQ